MNGLGQTYSALYVRTNTRSRLNEIFALLCPPTLSYNTRCHWTRRRWIFRTHTVGGDWLGRGQIAEIVKRNKGYAHSTAAARCLAIKYPFLEAEVVFAVEQVLFFEC